MLLHQQTSAWQDVLTTVSSKKSSVVRKTGKWDCRLEEMIVGDYLILPLTSARMLKSESYWMQNCCRDYIGPCIDHEYRVFSIRSRSGERLATLGLENNQGHWHLDQCYGPANIDVLEETFDYLDEEDILQTESFATEIYYVAHEVVRLMNADYKSH